ncbi:MAG TPA: helix-turn-helix transcriptional regulator [Bacillota bacterium]|nr:helix-turn-helix transcriptional regulator [Bacillota bacterium]HPF42635.1 helix-turn-helix transcriptional regulator [Bacillota bacterium]HPJ86200.1 helix-turn-helix transcriptional regulator [Bacillota bacterium]HPQ62266.1 helix-turn-helix transcriptional regulator [Bacillota bacterium]HRX91887.1 helix-turn-helix transcriptional regulator [Candidatus Izemoplasmatales bacterium]
MTIGEKIAARRKEMGYSQAELAARLYVSDKTISKWETGRGKPEIDTLKKISTVLGMTVDELLDDDMENQDTGNAKKSKRSFMEIISEKIPPLSYNKNDIAVVWVLGIGLGILLDIILTWWFLRIVRIYGLDYPVGLLVLQVITTTMLIVAIAKAKTDLRFLLAYMVFIVILLIYTLFSADRDFLEVLTILAEIAVPVLFILYIFGVVSERRIPLYIQLVTIILAGITFLTRIFDFNLFANSSFTYVYNVINSFNFIITSIAFFFLLKGVLGPVSDMPIQKEPSEAE